ncbi:hypothetical protein [Endozoicomonas sp. SCSIO W0465]|uniref:hypothetical protein n=1 Tax=Endozoicomonas sp. SCSIO W0465 TaxID=2918516 RepID=UPI002074DB55|nr:hypothetical protein [Endozoicomonas sp. SCSIO W0465]USE39502.1 hypothetical protein MJO57_15870 [Endozoicomonas sp. SCSIO W0465]
MKKTKKQPKNPFAFTKSGKAITIEDPIVHSEELYDSPALQARLYPVAIRPDSNVGSHFRLEDSTHAARGEEGHLDATDRHIQEQIRYRDKGYVLEETMLFTDGSKYVLDCYNPETQHIVEVVDNHDDIAKARVLKALGFKVTWHFVSNKKYSKAYTRYGEVICDY